MFNYIFANYKKSTDPDIIKSHNTAFDFYRELGLSPPDPSIIDGQNEWFKRYKVISILRIDRYLKQNLTIETNWNAVSDSDKQNCRIAIVQFIDWLLRNGQESSISITGSIAGQSFSKNTNLAKFELPPDVLIALEKVSFFSPLTPPAKLAASNFSKSQIDQIKAVFYDLFFSNYPATAEVLANKLLENTIFLNKIKGPQGPKGDKGDTGSQGPQGITDGYETPGITPQKDDFSVKIAGKTGGVSKSNIFIADTGNIFFDTAPITDAGKVDTPQIKINGVGDAALKGKEPLWDNNIIWWELLKRKLLSKAEKDAVYNKAEVDTKLALKADKATIYTKTETDNKLATNAKVVRALADWFINNFSTLKTDLLAKIATKNDLIKINLDTLKNVNGVLFKNWKIPTQLTDFQNLFIPGKDYELIWRTEKYWVKATYLSGTYWYLTGFQDKPQNPEGFGYIYFYINSTLSSGIFNIINLRNLKAVENQFKYQYDGLNSFLNILNFLEMDQSKKRLAQYVRELVTLESILAIGSGVIYTKLASALAPQTTHIDGHRMGWVRNDTPPVWTGKRLTLNAWKGWDWSAIISRGETNFISGYTQAKRFYKGDKLNLYIDAHISTFDRQGIFLIFKDKNGTLLTISARKYQNWWLGSNEFARATNTLNCDQAAVVQHNPQKNTYFKISHFEIKFENSAIFVETQSIMDNDTDINHTISHATINYPVGFLDDGIEFVGIELNRTNWINGTNSLNGTIKTSNNNNYQFKFDSQIIIKESTFNKQLAATKRGVKL